MAVKDCDFIGWRQWRTKWIHQTPKIARICAIETPESAFLRCASRLCEVRHYTKGAKGSKCSGLCSEGLWLYWMVVFGPVVAESAQQALLATLS